MLSTPISKGLAELGSAELPVEVVGGAESLQRAFDAVETLLDLGQAGAQELLLSFVISPTTKRFRSVGARNRRMERPAAKTSVESPNKDIMTNSASAR